MSRTDRVVAFVAAAAAIAAMLVADPGEVHAAPAVDPTVDTTRPVLRYEPFNSPRTVKEARSVRSPREARKPGR